MPLRKRDGNWHYRFWVDGREYTGNTDLVATERNRNAAARAEAKSRELVLSGRAHELRIEVKPFSDAAREFLEWAKGEHQNHPSTTRRLEVSFTSLGAFFKAKPLSTILRGDVNDYKSWRRTEHEVRDITIRHDLHALSKAFKYFIDHNWARESPVKGVEIPSDKDAIRMHVLAAAEEEIYFERAAKRFPALYDLGRLMLNQGCRPEEILALQVTDIDLEHSRLTIRAGKSRAARRTLKLTAESRAICARRIMATTSSDLAWCECGHAKRKHDQKMGQGKDPKCVCGCTEFKASSSRWLFPGKTPGTSLTKLNGPHGRILDDLATCKCDHAKHQHGQSEQGREPNCACGCCEFNEASRMAFVIYDFRHSFATRAAEAGMPVATLAAILGHADLRSVMKYVHVRQEAQDLAMDRFDQAQNRTDEKLSSGFRPVDGAEKRESAGSSGILREGLTDGKIN